MNLRSIGLATLVITWSAIAASGSAQTVPPDAPPAPPAVDPATSGQSAKPDRAAPPAGNGVRALRISCREEVMSKGLDGPARREAVSACVVRHRPDLAGREQCRTEGFARGLRKDELHAFVKDCTMTKG